MPIAPATSDGSSSETLKKSFVVKFVGATDSSWSIKESWALVLIIYAPPVPGKAMLRTFVSSSEKDLFAGMTVQLLSLTICTA